MPEIYKAAYEVRNFRAEVRIKFFTKEYLHNTELEFDKRLDQLASLLRDKIVANISYPVEGSGSDAVRSRPGQYPRADTTRLMKDIFWSRESRLVREIGTSLNYGLELELFMNRSFLVRTLEEQAKNIGAKAIKRL